MHVSASQQQGTKLTMSTLPRAGHHVFKAGHEAFTLDFDGPGDGVGSERQGHGFLQAAHLLRRELHGDLAGRTRKEQALGWRDAEMRQVLKGKRQGQLLALVPQCQRICL